LRAKSSKRRGERKKCLMPAWGKPAVRRRKGHRFPLPKERKKKRKKKPLGQAAFKGRLVVRVQVLFTSEGGREGRKENPRYGRGDLLFFNGRSGEVGILAFSKREEKKRRDKKTARPEKPPLPTLSPRGRGKASSLTLLHYGGQKKGKRKEGGSSA